MRKTAAVVVALALVSGTAFANDESAPVETEERSPVWLTTFIASSVIVVGSISLYAYGAHRVDAEADLVRINDPSYSSITEQDCDSQYLRDADGHFDSACTWSKRSNYAALTTLIIAPVAVISGYLAFRELPKKE